MRNKLHREYNNYQIRGYAAYHGDNSDDIVFTPFEDMAVNASGTGAVIGAAFGVEGVELNLLLTASSFLSNAIALDNIRQALPCRVVIVRDLHPQRWSSSYTPEVYLKSVLFHSQYDAYRDSTDILTNAVFNNNIRDEFDIMVDQLVEIPPDTTGAFTTNPEVGFETERAWTPLSLRYQLPCDFVAKAVNSASYCATTSVIFRTVNYMQANQLWCLVMHNGYQGLTADGLGRDNQRVRVTCSSKVLYHSF